MSDVEFPEEPPDGWCNLINTSRFQCVFDDTASLDSTDEWLAPDELAQKRTSEHSQQTCSDQEKRILKNAGSSVEPQRERQPNVAEPPTEEPNPAKQVPCTPGRPPVIDQRETSSNHPELFPTLRSPQREQPALNRPSLIPERPSTAPAPSTQRPRCQTSAPVRHPGHEPAFMHHFAMLHTAKSATSSPPSRIFKETGAQCYPAAAHLALSSQMTTSRNPQKMSPLSSRSLPTQRPLRSRQRTTQTC
jgi:hypothetical protein